MSNIFKKLKVPSFFKTKKFFILISVFVLFFLFTPVSLHQIGNRVESFINDKAKEGVKKFEKQTGLKIEWELLDFNIFITTFKLEGVKITPLDNSNFQKIQVLHFLDGLQKFKKISARPSLYSLFFEKQIILSKVQIQEGDIYLKTLKSFIKQKNEPHRIDLPIRKLIIKDTNLNLKHQDHNLSFSKVRSAVSQKQGGEFRFNLFVEAFRILKKQDLKKFQSYLKHNKNLEQKNEVLQEEDESFKLSLKGLAQKDKVSFREIKLENEKFQSLIHWLDIHFDNKGLKTLGVESSGSLPFSLIQKGLDLTGRRFISFDSFLSYKLNVQYKKNKGYQGFFEIEGKDTIFKSEKLKHFSLKGRLINYLLTVDKGLIQTQAQGSINIKKGELIFKGEPLQFNFSVETDKLSSDFVSQNILNFNQSPIQGDFTGSILCRGAGQVLYLKCETKGKSERASIYLENQDEIVSLYGMNLSSDIEWDRQILNFTINGEKADSSKIYLKGKYLYKLNKLETFYSFLGDLEKDLKFNTPFPLEGQAEVQEGKLLIDKNKIKLDGFIASPDLKIKSYKLKNISGLYKFENNKLQFSKIKGSPHKSNYSAESSIDFKKKEFILKLESPFFDIEDFLEMTEEKVSPPVSFKGTGTVSFFIKYPWSSAKKKEFQLSGDLFNVSVDRDFFQQTSFDFGMKNSQGFVRSLFFRKGQGFIKGAGSFDDNHSLDLNIIGQSLSLERLEWLNSILPFHQSGDVDFSMKITGTPEDPKINSDVLISKMFFYSYPVNDSNINFKMDKKAFSFSGNIMDEINIEKFTYPFSKNSKILAIGQFSDLDFITILFSKDRMEKSQDYFSKVTGSFSFSKNKKILENWNGFAKLDKFFISKSNRWIRSEKAFSVFFGKNKLSLTPTKFFQNNNKSFSIEERKNGKLFLSGKSSLSLFSVFFPFLERFSGDIGGQVLIDNNLKKMHPKGSIEIEKGLFSISPLPDFTNVKTSLVFLEDNIFINNFTSRAGEGLVKGEGVVFFDFINLPHLNLNLNFSSAYLNIPEDFKTKGSGNIQIEGKKPPYLISGQYIIDSGAITKDFSENTRKTKYNFSFLDKKVKNQASIFELKLNVKTKGAVTVNSSLIRSSIEGQADIYGLLESLLINGKFTLSTKSEENLIFFRGQEFKISSGSILFKNSVPENPYLNIKADTIFKEQIIDSFESNQEIERTYKIFLSLEGQSKNPKFSFKSSPSLNEKEIISLLTLGVGSRHFDANVKQNVTDYSYQLLGSLLLEKPLNREIRNTLGLDFRLTPYINTLNKPVTKITLSKNWFEKWKTSFSRTIEDAQSDIRLKYDLNQKVSLTAFWENGAQIELEDDQEDRLGLDFEFNFDF